MITFLKKVEISLILIVMMVVVVGKYFIVEEIKASTIVASEEGCNFKKEPLIIGYYSTRSLCSKGFFKVSNEDGLTICSDLKNSKNFIHPYDKIDFLKFVKPVEIGSCEPLKFEPNSSKVDPVVTPLIFFFFLIFSGFLKDQKQIIFFFTNMIYLLSSILYYSGEETIFSKYYLYQNMIGVTYYSFIISIFSIVF